ncbi:MAG: hypothetical protein M0R75_00495 [Dehalococcoidia bacterium]|nr:hypothetical protein [Dehalococcoidia bacterium]
MAKNNDRLEREINEILGNIEQFPDAGSRAKRNRRKSVNRVTSRIADIQRGIARRMGHISVSQLMLASFLMILFAFFFRGRGLPPTFASWILLGGVILFVSTFVVMLFGPRGRGGGSAPQRWRGRTIEYRSGSSFPDRIRHWWSSRARR